MQNVAVIGTSFGAKVHVPAFQHHPDFNVIAIAGRNSKKTAATADALGIEGTTNWQDFLFDERVDLIAVATPPYLHYEMAKAILNSGKHLLLEKPTTTHALEARELLTLAESQQLVAMMSHEFRWLPERFFFAQVLKERIGELREIHANFYMSFASSSETPPYGWLWDERFDGGILGALGSHLIDYLRFASDMEFSQVKGNLFTRTKQRKDSAGNYQRVTADDGFAFNFTLSNGATGILNASASLHAAPPSQIIASGTEGTALLQGTDVFFAAAKQFEQLVIPTEYLLKDYGADYRINPYMKFLDQLSAALSNGSSRSPSLYDGWKNQQILDAVRISHTNGTAVNL